MKTKTTLFTAEQRSVVDDALNLIVIQALVGIRLTAIKVHQLDNRPSGVYNPSDPNDCPSKYRFPYVDQGMLEELIERLQEKV